MINNTYYAYDIHLNSNNELMIAKYKVYDETIENRSGKKQSYRHYDYLGVDIPSNIEEALYELREENYLPMTRFRQNNFNVEVKNPLVYTKLMLLGFHHQILEKFYSLGHGYDNFDITTYITYINMNTGKVSFMEVGKYWAYDRRKIKLLEDEGYLPEEKSYYYLEKRQEEDLKRKR